MPVSRKSIREKQLRKEKRQRQLKKKSLDAEEKLGSDPASEALQTSTRSSKKKSKRGTSKRKISLQDLENRVQKSSSSSSSESIKTVQRLCLTGNLQLSVEEIGGKGLTGDDLLTPTVLEVELNQLGSVPCKVPNEVVQPLVGYLLALYNNGDTDEENS